ncbi:MAG: energy transducer TonB [Deltaproteobacteria bacterium]|nr:energy transducer TonB [Deltaproteobacteria bacterium]
MLVKTFIRCGIMLVAIALMSGCESSYEGAKAPPPDSPTSQQPPTIELAQQAPLRVQGDVPGPVSRDVDSLRKTFEDNKTVLGNVYGKTLASEPSMADGMVVRLHILPNGAVDNGAVRLSTSGNPSFDAEVVEAMTSWKFAPIKGAALTAEYPVIFAPSAGAAAAVESDLNTKLANVSPGEPSEYASSPSLPSDSP